MNLKRISRPLPLSFLFAVLVSLLPSCAIVGGYDARAHEHLTSLKAQHLKIIDDNTVGDGRSFSSVKLAEAVDATDLKFREAKEFALTLGGGLRNDNLLLLHDIFELHVANMRAKSRLLSVDEASLMKSSTVIPYDGAIRGEIVRSGNPSNPQ